MTTKAIIKTSDLMRMAMVAKKTGMRVEIEIDGTIIRVAPDVSPASEKPAVKKERIQL
ncbi:hypothetical protein ACQKKX_02510 [Neorhizobium sp. NPDC001467]|uniref:hypothetical protein n=1 Tax=Neorhizobium sp. NPDC001467 TaxID=3390595 RepID=UPI003CFE42C5